MAGGNLVSAVRGRARSWISRSGRHGGVIVGQPPLEDIGAGRGLAAFMLFSAIVNAAGLRRRADGTVGEGAAFCLTLDAKEIA